MTSLTLRVVWPIVDPFQFGELSYLTARRELPRIAEGLQATVVGKPDFTTSRGCLVCEAPAFRRQAVR